MTHVLWRRLAIGALLLSALASFAPGASALAHGRASAAPAATQGWPTYLHDVARTSASAETILSTSNVAQLRAQWTYLTGGGIAASPTVVNGVAYVGSWDGYEYAINATTGVLVWKTFLGQTITPNCQPSTIGVTSAATVINGVVYVGGGDANWYALDAATGAVLWSVYTGDNSITGGHYNWSSPLIYNNDAYIGIASNCDIPLVQGQLLQVDLTTHQVVHTANFVPNGEVGGGIWSSPSLDTATNTIFVTTGTQAQLNEQMAQAIVALDASTLAIKSYWQIPLNQRVNDADWGTTPLLFTDATGRQLVSAVNKNGVLYAFLRSNLSAGPVWEQRIALGGECPQCGDGGISSGAFANGVLYYAAGNDAVNGVGYPGTVRALDAATGRVLWIHSDSQPVFAAIAYDNGVIFDGVGTTLEALDASSGARLYSYATGGPVYSAPSVSGGAVFFGSTDNRIYSLSLPSSVPAIAKDPHCPTGWTCQDINNTTTPGTESLRNGAWSVTGAGAGIRGVADQFRLISQPATGDAQVIAQALTEPTRNSGAQSGVIMRQSNDAGSPFYAVLEYASDTPDGVTSPTLKVLYRAAFGGGVTQAIRISPTNLPVYLMIQRVGDTFRAATSTDGSTYRVVPGSRVVLTLPATVLTGLAVDSGSAATAITDTFSQVSVGAPTIQTAQASMPSPCPANWNCYDVGNTAPVGSQTVSSSGQWTLLSTGTTINFYADQFHFVYQTLTGDGSIQARVVSQTNTAPGAMAGVMLRQSLDPGAAYYGVFVTPKNGIVVQYRGIQGLRTTHVTSIAGAAPIYLKVTRYTDTSVSPAVTYYAAYTSSDGANWSFVPWSTAAIAMGASTLAGMVASTYASGVQATVVMDAVSVSSSTTPPPTLCPSGWSCGDVGFPSLAGAQTVNNGVWSVSGAGSDIWDVSDQFYFVNQTLSGNGGISAHVTAQTNTDAWAKAGVMLRATTDTAAPYYAAFITPGNGLAIQYRTTQGGATAQIQVAGMTVPVYLRVARYTDTNSTPSVTYFTTYTSTDGATWTPIAGSTVTLAMSDAVLVGMAVTSHNSPVASVATFDSVAIQTTAPIPAGVCPASFSCGDIGAATPAGSQVLSAGTWTIQGGGGDIWGTADSFHYVWQSLASDGSVSAQVSSQTNTDPWAKAGVMLRATTDPASPYYAVYLTPGNGLAVQYRATAGGSAAQAAQITTAAPPLYLEVARVGSSFSAYTSTDGVTWTLVGASTINLPNLSGALLAGLAVTSHNTGALSAAVFSAFTIRATTPPPPACPTSWTCADIGAVGLPGSQTLSNGTWTIQGGGSDIWGTADSFHYVWQSLASDGSVSAQVVSLSNTDPWAKAGVMLRATTDPAAPFYAAYITPSNGVAVQYRTTQGGSAGQAAQVAGSATPLYLKVTRTGTSFSAYTSTDGVTWTLVSGSTVTLSNLSGALLAGMAVTAHNNGAINTATFNAVSIG